MPAPCRILPEALERPGALGGAFAGPGRVRRGNASQLRGWALPTGSGIGFMSSRRERFNRSPGRPRGALGTGEAIPRAPKGAIQLARGQGTLSLTVVPPRLNRPTSGALGIGGVSQGSRWSPWARVESPPFGGWRHGDASVARRRGGASQLRGGGVAAAPAPGATSRRLWSLREGKRRPPRPAPPGGFLTSGRLRMPARCRMLPEALERPGALGGAFAGPGRVRRGDASQVRG